MQLRTLQFRGWKQRFLPTNRNLCDWISRGAVFWCWHFWATVNNVWNGWDTQTQVKNTVVLSLTPRECLLIKCFWRINTFCQITVLFGVHSEAIVHFCVNPPNPYENAMVLLKLWNSDTKSTKKHFHFNYFNKTVVNFPEGSQREVRFL